MLEYVFIIYYVTEYFKKLLMTSAAFERHRGISWMFGLEMGFKVFVIFLKPNNLTTHIMTCVRIKLRPS